MVKHGLALVACGEIEIGQFHSLLHLEGAITNKKHMGRVGLDVFHRLAVKAPSFAFKKQRIKHGQ